MEDEAILRANALLAAMDEFGLSIEDAMAVADLYEVRDD